MIIKGTHKAEPTSHARPRAPRLVLLIAGIVWAFSLWSSWALSEQISPAPSSPELTLKQAVLCEGLKDNGPADAGVLFSCGIGKMICHTSFDPASQKATIFHGWYHRGRLISKQRININPPGWTASSSIQIREADKGPWQVEITDNSGRILKVLRFSVVD